MIQCNLKKIFIAVFTFGTLTTYAQPQDELAPISARPFQAPVSKAKKKTTASISLPFFDDFSYDSHIPDTTLWEDANVYINQTFPEGPPTLGVATFDGLNKDGLAYDLSNLNTDSCDVLTSKPINLTGAVDTVYLSFFWQAGGLGERPEGNDSINLKFYDPTAKKWYRVWAMKSQDSTAFIQEMIPVTKSVYLTDGFKFRFTSFGAQAGALDTWNLDYVKLDENRTMNDTLFDDVAFTRPHPSLLSDFESIPWFHYSSFIQNTRNLIVHYQRNKNTASQNMNLCVYEVREGANVLTSDAVGNPGKDDNHPDNIETVYACDIGDFFANLTIPNQEFEITAYQTYFGSNEDDSPNDTITRNQVFSNYYALDDGSAERAYQVKDNDEGVIMTKYDIASSDSLKGVYFYFIPSQYNIEDKQFSIVVYANNAGQPGALIYESDSLYTPRYTSSNFFLPYQLDIPSGLWITGPVFIGLRQKSNVRLPIGFDVNHAQKNTIVYGRSNDLYQSFFRGNLMVRPYFKYDPIDLTIKDNDLNSLKIDVYPNPAQHSIYINGLDENTDYSYLLISNTGQVVQSGELDGEIKFSNKINTGLYVLQVSDKQGKHAPTSKKVLVRR